MAPAPPGRARAGAARVVASSGAVKPRTIGVEAERRPLEDLRELRSQRGPHSPHEPPVAGDGRDVQSDDPARGKVLAHEPEELARREVERHVRLVVGVDDDQVVALVRRAEERTRIGVVDDESRVVAHPEVASTDPAYCGVELDAIHAGQRVEDAERARSRSRGVPEDRDPLQIPPEKRRAPPDTCPTSPPVSTESGLQTE